MGNKDRSPQSSTSNFNHADQPPSSTPRDVPPVANVPNRPPYPTVVAIANVPNVPDHPIVPTAPILPIPSPPTYLRMTSPQEAAVPSKSFTSHHNELVNLLDKTNHPPSTYASKPPRHPPLHIPNFPTTADAIAPPTQQPTHKPTIPFRKSPAMGSENRSVQRRNDPSQSTSIAPTLAQPSARAQPKPTIDITAGLTHAITSNNATTLLSNPVTQRSQSPAKKYILRNPNAPPQTVPIPTAQQTPLAQSSAHSVAQASDRPPDTHPVRAQSAPPGARHSTAPSLEMVPAAVGANLDLPPMGADSSQRSRSSSYIFAGIP